MSKPKFSLEMRGSNVFENSDLEAAAGSEFTVEYDPAKASVSVDYSSEDHLKLVVKGEANLRAIGFKDLTVGTGVQLDKDGLTVTGSIEWTITKALAAKVEVERTPTSTGGTMTLTIKF